MQKRGLGRLSHENLVAATMKKMEKDGFIIRPEANSVNIRNYYSLNPEIIRTYVKPSSFSIVENGKPIHITGEPITDIDLIDLFLTQISTLLRFYSIPFVFEYLDNYWGHLNVVHFELLKNRHDKDEQRKKFITRYSTITDSAISKEEITTSFLRKFSSRSKVDFISFLEFLESLSIEISDLGKKIDWFLKNAFNKKWESDFFLDLDVSDPELAGTIDNYFR